MRSHEFDDDDDVSDRPSEELDTGIARYPSWFSALHGLLKAVAIPVGLVGTVLCLVSLAGVVVPILAARVAIAVVVALAIPWWLSNRLYPVGMPLRAIGLRTDVFAVWLLGFLVLYAFAAGSVTRPLLLREGDRQSVAGYRELAYATYLLGGYRPVPPASAVR